MTADSSPEPVSFSPSEGARSRSPRLARGALATSAAVFFVVCSGFALVQVPRIPTHAANASRLERFLRPVERNPPLYSLDSDLYGVYATDERHVWAVGNRGTIVHTEDGGRTWVRQSPHTEQPIQTPTPTPTPAATPPAANNSGNANSARATANANRRTVRNANVRQSNRRGNGNRNVNTNGAQQFGNSNRDFAHAPAPSDESGSRTASDAPRATQAPAPAQQTTRQTQSKPTATPPKPNTTPTPQRSVPSEQTRLTPTPTPPPSRGNSNGVSTRNSPTTQRPTPTPRRTPANTASPANAPSNANTPAATTNTNAAANTNNASNANASANTNGNLTPSAPGVDIQEDLVAVIFNGDRYGWVAGRSGHTTYFTADRGDTWNPSVVPEALLGVAIAYRSVGRSEYFILHPGPNLLRLYELNDQGELYSPDNVSLAIPLPSPSTSRAPVLNVGTPPFHNSSLFSGDVYFSQPYAQGESIRVGENGSIYVVGARFDGLAQSNSTANLRAIAVAGAQHENVWVVGDGGTILHSTDGGRTWPQTPQNSGTTWTLNGVYFLDDALHGFAVGRDGLILGTSDGGASWVRLTRGSKDEKIEAGAYSRGWPGWYYLSLFLTALLLAPAVVPRKKDEPPPEVSVADVLVSDRPLEAGDPDPLFFHSVALGLSRFLRNESTLPPLTIAITGEWGTGKSSLMNVLRADLRSYGFRPVWFNAWHHQKEEHLLAALLQNVRLQAIPRWWRPVGLLFRARLLVIRGWRRWLPVLALLFVSAALTTYAVLRFRHGATAAADDPLVQLVSNVKTLFGGEPKTEGAAQTTGVLALVVGVGSIVAAVWRGAKAFGANPASLLATVSHSMKLRDLDAQTSFRKRFADEFGDVTRALGARSMIVFIDDLDRCKPDNVLEVLEGVNFLVSSGECFVVLGMARDLVERYVGLSFKDVAAEVSPDGGQAAKPARAARAEFAHQYLDKLINIEVPVPEPTPAQASELLVSAGARPAPPTTLALRWAQARVWAARAAPVAVALVALIAGGYAGRELNDRLHSTDQQNANAQTAVTGTGGGNAATDNNAANVNAAADANNAADANRNTARSRGNANRTSQQADTNAQANTDASARRGEDEQRAQGQTAALSPPSQTRRSPLSYWLPALAVALGASVLFWRLKRRPDRIVKDSEEFKDALRIWHPVIFAMLKTPRGMKRFMNRVRYLAMRQRPPAAQQSVWERLRNALARRLGFTPRKASAEQSHAHIDEHMLVALSARQLIDAFLEDDRRTFVVVPGEGIPSHIRDLRELLGKVEQAHERKFGYRTTEIAGDLRSAFLKMSADIRVN